METRKQNEERSKGQLTWLEKAFTISQIVCFCLMAVLATTGLIAGAIQGRTLAEMTLYLTLECTSILCAKQTIKELDELNKQQQ